jgi:hypothetical protein
VTLQRFALIVGVAFWTWPVVWHLFANDWPPGSVFVGVFVWMLPALFIGTVLWAVWNAFVPGKRA